MAINKVDLGNQNLIDLTQDTVSPEKMAKGTTAHDKSGNIIEGKMSTETVLYTSQSLTEEQKAQARLNIGADDAKTLNGFKIVVSSTEPSVNDSKIITIVI